MKLGYRTMSILLVDSVTMCTDTLQSYLKDFQFYRMWTARNVEEALKIIRDKPINLLVTAWKMLPQSGFQLVEAIRKDPKLQDAMILMMMDRKDVHVKEKGDQLKVNGYLNLPLQSKAVVQIVEGLLSPLIDEDEEEFQQQMHNARIAMRKGNLQKAEDAYRAALAVRAEEETFLGLGKILRDKGDLPGAEKCFMGALKLSPKSLRAFLGLASVYQTAGRLEDALKVLAAAAGACKSLKEEGDMRASIHFYMGEVELQLKRLKDAMGYFEQASQLSGDDPKMASRIGDALSDNGLHAEAEEYYTKALELDPDLAHVYNRLGISYRKQGKLDMALNLYLKALTFHPDDENLIYNIARTQWDMENYKPAAEQLTRALKINPDFREARILLDAVLNKMGFKVREKGAPPDPED